MANIRPNIRQHPLLSRYPGSEYAVGYSPGMLAWLMCVETVGGGGWARAILVVGCVQFYSVDEKWNL